MSQPGESFLKAWGIELESLADGLDAGEDTAVLLVGSIPEGLANPDSDIDLLVLGDYTPRGDIVFEERQYADSVTRTGSGHDLNVQAWSSEQLEDIAARVGGILDTMRHPEGAERVHLISPYELNLLHRIRVGVPIGPEAPVERWRATLATDQLPACSALTQLGYYGAAREDVFAQLEEGEDASALWMLMVALEHLASAVLASVGETNAGRKWLIRLLQRHRDTIGALHAEQLQEYLLGHAAGSAQEIVRDATELSDRLILEAVGRVPELAPALAELQKRIQLRMTL